MDLTISRPVKIGALVAVLAAFAFAAAMMFLTPGGDVSSAAQPLPVKPKLATAAAKSERPRKQRPREARPAVAANGLPVAIADALTRKRAVVVALAAPDGAVDELAVRESRAGALVAGAEFVSINVLSQREAAPLTKLLGVLDAPSVLIYERPGTLAFRVDGFVDRDTVAQAVSDAVP